MEEKLPEPEIKEEVKVPEPDQMPDVPSDQPPAGDQLGVDAEGSGSGDSFGLVGKPGGKDITTIGSGDGAGRSKFAYFAGVLERRFVDEFNRNEALKTRDYTILIRVWLESDGVVSRFELDGSSGNAETDQAVKSTLASLGTVDKPPADLPQPVRLRVVHRGAS